MPDKSASATSPNSELREMLENGVMHGSEEESKLKRHILSVAGRVTKCEAGSASSAGLWSKGGREAGSAARAGGKSQDARLSMRYARH